MPLAGRSRVDESRCHTGYTGHFSLIDTIHVLEQLRMIFQVELPQARALLAGWISWASRCRIPAFVRLAKRSHASGT
jgi:transposase